MAPQKPQDKGSGSWDEYRLLTIETLTHLKEEVRKLHDKVLTIEVQDRVRGSVFGFAAGIVGAVVGGLVVHYLKQ